MNTNTAQAVAPEVAAVTQKVAAALPYDLFKELLRRKATAEVDRLAVLWGYSDKLMSVFVREKEKLEFQLPGLRDRLSQKVENWERTFARLGGANPSFSPALEKGEERLAELQACISILQNRMRVDSANMAREHQRLEIQHLKRSMLEQFRKEEREAAAKAEQERFDAWAKAKGY